MKVHLFYLDNYLYAFTATKDLAKKFMKQRCMKKLVHKVEEMPESQYSAFTFKYNTYMLIENPFDAKNDKYINVVTTYGEDEEVSAFVTSLEDVKDECFSKLFERIGFKKKIETILREGFSMLYNKDSSNAITINISALSILIYLFEPTFTGEGEVKVSRTIDFNLN